MCLTSYLASFSRSATLHLKKKTQFSFNLLMYNSSNTFIYIYLLHKLLPLLNRHLCIESNLYPEEEKAAPPSQKQKKKITKIFKQTKMLHNNETNYIF